MIGNTLLLSPGCKSYVHGNTSSYLQDLDQCQMVFDKAIVLVDLASNDLTPHVGGSSNIHIVKAGGKDHRYIPVDKIKRLRMTEATELQLFFDFVNTLIAKKPGWIQKIVVATNRDRDYHVRKMFKPIDKPPLPIEILGPHHIEQGFQSIQFSEDHAKPPTLWNKALHIVRNQLFQQNLAALHTRP